MTTPKGRVDLQLEESQRRLHEAQAAVQEGRVPFVHPAITDPRAIGHALGAAARAAQRSQEKSLGPEIRSHLSKYKTPVAGGEGPAMPALESRAQHGQTMASQAIATRAVGDSGAVRRAVESHQARPGSIIGQDPVGPGMPPAKPPPLLLLPSDSLPPDALQDPAFQRGAGSMLAQLQPHMAYKYGVVRGGRHITPAELYAMASAPAVGEQPQDFRSRMRRSVEETARDLEIAMQAPVGAGRPPPAADDFSPPPPASVPRTDEEAERQAARGPAGAAARTGKSPAPVVLKEDDDEDDKAIQEALNTMGDLDVASLRREMIRDILKNPKQREVIEARLKPFGADDLAQLLETNHLRQRVPIIPGVFEPTFETMDQDVEFRLKQLLMLESESVNVTSAYLLDKYAVMTTAAGTIAINNNPLPSMYTTKGTFDDELFWKKYNWLIRKPLHMLASLGIHYAWFEARARKLFKVEEVKNG